MRTFPNGATRDTDTNKADYRGYLSPQVLKRFGEYMLKHQVQPNGALRDSDNWKKGIPQKEYLSSLLRHVVDLWRALEGTGSGLPLSDEATQDLLCALLFNVQGLLHERLLGRDVGMARQHLDAFWKGVAVPQPEWVQFRNWLLDCNELSHAKICGSEGKYKCCDFYGAYLRDRT